MIDYRRVAEIRTGAETAVWRGRHPDSDQRVTVKEPAADLPPADRLRVTYQLRREHQFLYHLSSPRVVRATSWDDATGRLVFEDTQGSLAQLLARERRLGVDLVARVMTEILAGLADLHDRKLAHGYLCPHTVFLDPACEVKLGDFTGYRSDGEAPTTPDFVLKYQAPELLKSPVAADPPEVRAARADLYSVGYLALELLAGPGFDQLFGPGQAGAGEGGNWLWWHDDVSKSLPPLNKVLTDVPEAMLGILGALTLKDPAERCRRFRAARDVIAALAATGLVANRKLPPLDDRQSGGKPTGGEPLPPGRRVVVVKKPALELWAPDAPVHAARFGPGSAAVVGRVKGCRLVTLDPQVSAKHAAFVCQDTGRWWAYDLLSRTGVRVNGTPTAAAGLADGDTVGIGGGEYRVVLNPDPIEDIGKFEPVRRLHAGQAGELFLARWRLDGRPAVVRVFPAGFAANTDDIQRFLRGIPEAGELRHPNLVALYRGGFLLRGGRRTWYLASEYLPGGSLRDRLAVANRPLAVRDVIRFGIDVCNALTVTAERKLVHRNVNPAAVLFAADGTAKLGDFFLLRDEEVKTLHQITQTGETVGSFVYQAPEMFKGSRHLTPAADLYSLAACMYHALTLRPPFNPDQPILELATQIREGGVTPPRSINGSVPHRLQNLLLYALDKQPQNRPVSPAHMARELAEIRDEAEPGNGIGGRRAAPALAAG